MKVKNLDISAWCPLCKKMKSCTYAFVSEETTTADNVCELPEMCCCDQNFAPIYSIPGTGAVPFGIPSFTIPATSASLPAMPMYPMNGPANVYPFQHSPLPEPAHEPLTEEQIRQIVADAMQKVLYPDNGGIVDGWNSRRIKMWDEDGTQWRGVVYRVEKEQAL